MTENGRTTADPESRVQGAQGLPSVPVVLATGEATLSAAARALAVLTDSIDRCDGAARAGSRQVVALTDRLSTEPARVAETRALIAGGAELLGIGAVEFVPPPQGGLFGRGGMGGDRLTVDLRGRGARFESVTLPRAVATADERWLVVAAPGPGVGAESRPIAAIAAYAGRRQRIVARLARGGAEPGILADLAAAAMPAVVVVVGMVPGWAGALAVATPDLIAAELVWLVLAEGIDQEDEPVGPWEDATVQRATELELGVRLPGQIDLRVGCPDQAGGGQAAALGRLGDRLRLRLGIPNRP